MYVDEAMRPWCDTVLAEMPGIALFDAHTHVGGCDPDGFRCDVSELLDALALTESRGVVFPMHEPEGYAVPNKRLLDEVEASEGRLVAFCRVDPAVEPTAEVERCVAAGARGVKLHPRAERFALDDRRLDAVFALANERRLPVLVHAGRGIPALGRHALERSSAYPDVPLILAHAGISDLSWIWRHAPEHPNLFFDSSCWVPADLLALFALVPPGQILYASDVPYATSVQGVITTFRCAMQVGLTKAQLESVAGAQLQRLVDGEPALDCGPAPGSDRIRSDLVLDRVHAWILLAMGQIGAGGLGERPLGVARLACDVPAESAQAGVCRSILELLARHERAGESVPAGRETFATLHLLGVATVVSATPDVAVPELTSGHSSAAAATASGSSTVAASRSRTISSAAAWLGL